MSAANYSPTGLVVAMVTPFREDESIDFDRLVEHIEFLLAADVSALAPVAGCGEFVSLSPQERRAVVEATVAAVDGRVPVVVGCLAPGTREAADTAAMAAKAGANAVLVLPPYYIAASRSGIVAHFRDVAAASGLPMVVYNNPPRTARDIDADLLLELAEIPEVVGIKECDRDLGRASAKIAMVGSRIAFMCGDDDLVFPMLAAGAAGAIMALPNLAPRLCCSLFDAFAAADVERARELHEIVRQLVHVRRIPNHPGPLKETMAMIGRPAGLARRPLLAMTESERAAVQAVVDELGPRLC